MDERSVEFGVKEVLCMIELPLLYSMSSSIAGRGS